MFGAREKLLRVGGVEERRELFARCFFELRVGKGHRGLRPQDHEAIPGNVHVVWVGNGKDSDGAGPLQGFPAFFERGIVRAKSTGDSRGSAV